MAAPLRSLDSAPVTEVVDEQNPWPGLASFEERYEKYFHGRLREQTILLRRVLRQRLTILTGRSGMGKTSLLRAGLFPLLRGESIFPVSIKLDLKADGGSADRQIFDAILEQAGNPNHPVEAPSPLPGESVWEYLHRSDADFWSHDNLLLTPLLAFDAFEDVLALRGRPAGLAEEVQRFLVELADLVAGRVPGTLANLWRSTPNRAERIVRGQHNYKIVLSLREDYWADLDDWSEDHLASGLRNRLRLLPMNGEQALDAVRRPGEHLVEADVAERIVRWVSGSDVEKQPPADSVPLERLTVEPALLSLVCRELNNKRLERKLPKITEELEKGQRTIIEDFYARCMADVQPSVRKFVEDELLLPEGRRDTIALQTVPQAKDPAFLSDLGKLQDRRLLRIEPRDGVERVELTHDVLTSAVRANRDARSQIEAARRDAKKQVIGLLIALIFVGVAGIVAWVLWSLQSARLKAAQATKGQATAEGEKRETDHLLAVADLRAAASLTEDGRAAEGLAFLARSARKTGQAAARTSATPTAPDPLGLAVRAAILDNILLRNWPLPVAELAAEGQLLTSRFDDAGHLLVVRSSGPKVRVWVARDPAHVGAGRELPPFPSAVTSADLSGDGRRLLIAAKDGRCQLWDVEALRPLGGIVQVGAPLDRMILAPNGRTALALFGPGQLRFWDVEAGRSLSPVRRHRLADRFYAAELSRDGRFAVTAANDSIAQVWAVPSGRAVGSLRHQGVVLSARFSADGRKVVTASADGTARVWNTRSGESSGLPLNHGKDQVVRWAELSPDGRTVATGSWDSTARLWDAVTGRSIGKPMLHQGRVQSVRFSPDGRLLLTASSDGTARLWGAHNGCPTHEPINVRQALVAAVFSPDGGLVLTIPQSDPRPRVWDVGSTRAREAILQPGEQAATAGPELICQAFPESRQAGTPGLIFNTNPPPGAAARLSRLGNVLAVARNGEVRLYRVQGDRTLTPVPRPFALQGEVAAIALSPDGSRLAAAWRLGASGRVRVWDTATGKTLIDSPPGGPYSSLDFSPDGRTLAAAWESGRIDSLRIDGSSPMALQDEKVPRSVNDHLAMVRFSPDGTRLATAYWDFTARIWDVGSGQSLYSVSHLGRVFSVALSRDGRRLVTAAANGIARMTRADSVAVLSNMVHPVSVWSADFGPEAGEASRIVTVAADGRVRLWEPTTAQVLGSLEPPVPAIGAQFLLDGQSLITVSNDGSVRLWDTPTASPEDSELVASFAEAVGGLKVNERGVAAPLFSWSQTEKLEDLRRASLGAPEGQPSALSILRWFFADRAHRSFSPLRPRSPAGSPGVAK